MTATLWPVATATVKELTAQERFDEQYVTSTEICARLKINRATLLFARRRKKVPEGISTGLHNVMVWERSVIEPYLEKWQHRLENNKILRR